MAQRDYKALLGGLLTGFLTGQDAVKAMQEWLLGELMKIESEARVGAGRGQHSGERETCFSGFTTTSNRLARPHRPYHLFLKAREINVRLREKA